MLGEKQGRIQTCCHCGTNSTPCWRKGPPEKPVLCNACGARWLVKNDLNGYLPGSKSKASSSNGPSLKLDGGVVKPRAPKPKLPGIKRKSGDCARLPAVPVFDLAALAAAYPMVVPPEHRPLFGFAHPAAGAPPHMASFCAVEALLTGSSGASSDSDGSVEHSLGAFKRDDASSVDSQDNTLAYTTAVSTVAGLLQQHATSAAPSCSQAMVVAASLKPVARPCALFSRRPRKQSHPTMCY